MSPRRNIQLGAEMGKQTFEVNFALKIRVMEDLHGNLFLSFVKLLQFGVLDVDIFLNVLARQHDFLVPATTVNTVESPVANSCGSARQKEHEKVGFEPSIFDNREEALDDIRNDDEEGSKMIVVECTVSFSKAYQRRVFDSGVVGDPHRRGGHVGLEDRNN